MANEFPAVCEFSSLDGSNGFVINRIGGGDQAGYSISEAGDVNGDGVDDQIIGAPRGTSGGNGKSYIVFGSDSGLAATVELSSLDGSNGIAFNSSNGYFGYSFSGAGDVNNDGLN